MAKTSTPDIDWNSLGFQYVRTDCHIRYVWRNGAWSRGDLIEEEALSLHVAATALHYGQSCFEGLKAFGCRDGAVRLFRPEENAARMHATAQRLCMAPVPTGLFLEAVHRVVDANRAYVPPYGTGGSLYVRPLLIGSGPQIGVKPALEYTFLVMVMPVGAYYQGGLTPVKAVVLDDYDRAAPLGVGHVKVAGNYAASLEPHHSAQARGFPIELYLDAREHRFVEEFGTSNFIAISPGREYVTAASASILPSITNKGLQQLAEHMGMPVQVRPVPFSEVGTFTEVAACGTAVVITPVNEIVRGDSTIHVGPADGCGPVFEEMYGRYTAIQYGEQDDIFAWTVEV